jgi:hypothetical protein
MLSLPIQIECVKRELWMRRQVYPERVARKAMSQAKADQEIEAMESVLVTLESLHSISDGDQPDLFSGVTADA